MLLDARESVICVGEKMCHSVAIHHACMSISEDDLTRLYSLRLHCHGRLPRLAIAAYGGSRGGSTVSAETPFGTPKFFFTERELLVLSTQ